MAFVADIAADIASDWHVTVRKLAQTHGVSAKLFTLLSTRGSKPFKEVKVPKLLNEKMKIELVRTCNAFLVMVRHHSIAMLDQIITMG
jgi:hypothetical protein